MNGFLSTYRKIKGIFKRPKFKIFFGLWKNDPNLPCYRNGAIRLAKYGKYYYIQKSVLNEDKTKPETFTSNGTPIKSYKHTEHNIKPDYAWRRDIRKKLRKCGLGWIPPVIIIPWWFRIAVYNFDVMWKWKYDEVRYEFPPQFTIVFFGLCMTITLHEPTKNEYTNDDQYWEGILSYLYKYDRDIYKTVYNGGVWGCNDKQWFSIRPEHIIRQEDRETYMKATEDYRKKTNNYEIV